MPEHDGEPRVAEGKLLPCPFCGKPATIAIDEIGNKCGACVDLKCRSEGPIADNDRDAAIRWNTRAMQTQ